MLPGERKYHHIAAFAVVKHQGELIFVVVVRERLFAVKTKYSGSRIYGETLFYSTLRGFGLCGQ